MRAPRKKKSRLVAAIVVVSGFVVGLAAFTGALQDLYKFTTGLIPGKQRAPFTVMATPTELPEELKLFKTQESHRIESAPTMDEARLDIPAFDSDSEVWIEATCTAECFSDQSFVGIKVLYDGDTFVERESDQGRGTKTASAYVKILVRRGHPLQFKVNGADHLARRKGVTFAAYSSSLP